MGADINFEDLSNVWGVPVSSITPRIIQNWTEKKAGQRFIQSAALSSHLSLLICTLVAFDLFVLNPNLLIISHGDTL